MTLEDHIGENIDKASGSVPGKIPGEKVAAEIKDPVEDAINAQKAEWIAYAQKSQRDLAGKYDETAKNLIGLFSGIFGVFTLLLAFYGLPSQFSINFGIAILTIVCYAISICYLVYVMGPGGVVSKIQTINYYNSDEIWDKTIRVNQHDERNINIGIAFFIIAILLIPGSIVISMFMAGETVQIVAPQDKIPCLVNASIPFRDNSTLSEEIQLIGQDSARYTFKLANGNTVKVSKDWIQAIVTKK
ncbi:MAG: hypothetical protein LUQ71_02640 [Methanoregula sp.]|nr:hypothetical protein [Methanoregula sp.]